MTWVDKSMNTQWQKNAHILLNSSSGYLTVDSQYSIRRSSYLGRIWFVIVDFVTRGKKTQQLNIAVEKTIAEVKKHLDISKEKLVNKLPEIPSDKNQLHNAESGEFTGMTPDQRKSCKEVSLLIFHLVLQQPINYGYFTDVGYVSLTKLPEGIRQHKQLTDRTKALPGLSEISSFYTFDFVQDPVKKEFIQWTIKRLEGV